MNEHVRINGGSQIVGSIPALLGFVPDECTVALFVERDGGRVRCLIRQDLDTPGEQVSRTLIDAAASIGDCDVVTAAYPRTLADWLGSIEPRVSGKRALHVSETSVCETVRRSMARVSPRVAEAVPATLASAMPRETSCATPRESSHHRVAALSPAEPLNVRVGGANTVHGPVSGSARA